MKKGGLKAALFLFKTERSPVTQLHEPRIRWIDR